METTVNLLEETINELLRAGKTEDDVLWCGNSNVHFLWEHFKQVADVEYEEGYGATFVPNDLYIVGNNWWLERHNYDGAEWWEFKELPKRHNKLQETLVKRVVGRFYHVDDQLQYINSEVYDKAELKLERKLQGLNYNA